MPAFLGSTPPERRNSLALPHAASHRAHPSGRGARGGLYSLLAAVPLDLAALYLALAALHLLPPEWPAAEDPRGLLLAPAVCLFALARTIALIGLRHVLRWRAASDDWSRSAVREPNPR